MSSIETSMFYTRPSQIAQDIKEQVEQVKIEMQKKPKSEQQIINDSALTTNSAKGNFIDIKV